MLQDDVADQYSFNNHVLRRFNETLKDAIDPNGILSPGRAGIWPAALPVDARSAAVMRLATRAVGVARLLSLCGGARASAQRAASVERGKAKFEHSCAPCHGAGLGDDGRAMLPGTDALRIKYKGALPALIEERTDLNADAMRTFVRRGTWSMPPFRPTEISEARDRGHRRVFASSRRAPPVRIGVMNRRSLLLGCAAAGAFIAFEGGAAELATDSPAATITTLQAGLIAATSKRTIEERYRALEPVVVATHDLPYIAEFALRRQWASLTEDRTARFIAAFQRFSVMTYAARFKTVAADAFRAIDGR